MRPLFATIFLLAGTSVVAQEKLQLPDGAVAQLGVHRLRVPNHVRDFVLSPDGSTLIVAIPPKKENESSVLLFDTSTGFVRKRLALRSAHRLAISQDRNALAIDTGTSVELWDLAKEERIRSVAYADTANSANSLAVSPDGRYAVLATVSKNRPILLRWDMTTGEAMPTLTLPGERVPFVHFSRDGSKLIGARNGDRYNNKVVAAETTIWDTKTGKVVREHQADGTHIAVSPEGNLVAQAADNAIHVVDIDAPKKRVSIPVASSYFAFLPDGKQLNILLPDGTIRLWDVVNNKELRALEGRTYAYDRRPQFSADGKTLAFLNEHLHNVASSFQLWQLASGKQFRYPTGHPNTVNGLAYSPNGKLLASCSGDVLLLYDPATGRELRRWIAHKSTIEQITFSPDGKLLASASVDGTIGVWDAATGQERHRFNARDSVKSIAFSRDGSSLISATSERTIQTWDLDKGVAVRSVVAPINLKSPILAPSGDLVASFGSGEARDRYQAVNLPIRWFNVRTGNSLPPLEVRPRSRDEPNGFGIDGSIVWEVVFSPDSKLFATSDSVQTQSLRVILGDHQIRVWETVTRREILRLTNLPAYSSLLGMSPDNRVLAHGIGQGHGWGWGAADRALILRDIASAQNHSMTGKEGNSPRQYDEIFKQFRQVTGHLGAITSMAFSPDSKFLATGGSDSVIYLWPVKDFLKPMEFAADKDDTSSYWPKLADGDAGKAYRAIAQLEHRPKDAVALLRKHVRPIPKLDEGTIAGYIKELSSTNFAARQRAYLALDKAGEQAAHALLAAQKMPFDLEMRRRIETLLEKLENPFIDADQLRSYRSLVLLERLNTPEAREFLSDLTQGAPAAWLTVEARHALKRAPGK